ncbi:hypothetical protein RhiTH_009836 [Rhizoctonia solani]
MGQLEPFPPPASPELGKVTLKQVICLLWGLQSQVDCIEWTLLEQTRISQENCTNVENISQTVDTVKDGLAQLQLAWGPHTPEEQKPPAVKETPRAAPKAKPIGKAQPFLGAPAPIISTCHNSAWTYGSRDLKPVALSPMDYETKRGNKGPRGMV